MGPLPVLLSSEGIIVFTTFACVVAIFALIANISVLVAFIKSKRLRENKSNYFAVNLALSDIFVCVGPLPLWLLNIWHIRTSIVLSKGILPNSTVRTYGIIWQFLDAFFTVASVFNLSLLSIERYFSIAKPLWTRVNFSRRIMVTACWLPWIYALLCLGPSLAFESGLAVIIAYKVVVILLPCFVMIAAYGLLVLHIRNDRRTRHLAITSDAIASNYVSSGGSSAVQRRNQKLTLRLSLLTFAFILCWLPYICWILWYTTSDRVEYIENTSYFFDVSISLKYLSYFNSVINPFLYVFGRPAFSIVLKDFLIKEHRITSRRLQRSVLAPPLSIVGSTLSLTTINSIHYDGN